MPHRASLYGSPVGAVFLLRSHANEFQSVARRRCLVHRLRRGQRSGRAEIVFDRNRRPHWQAQDFPTTRNSARQRLGFRVPAVPVHSRRKMMARLIGTAAIWVIRRCSRSSTNAMPAKIVVVQINPVYRPNVPQSARDIQKRSRNCVHSRFCGKSSITRTSSGSGPRRARARDL